MFGSVCSVLCGSIGAFSEKCQAVSRFIYANSNSKVKPIFPEDWNIYLWFFYFYFPWRQSDEMINGPGAGSVITAWWNWISWLLPHNKPPLNLCNLTVWLPQSTFVFFFSPLFHRLLSLHLHFFLSFIIPSLPLYIMHSRASSSVWVQMWMADGEVGVALIFTQNPNPSFSHSVTQTH